MPSSIKQEDKPVSIIVDQSMQLTLYAIIDAHGEKRAYFHDKGDAEEFAAAANQQPVLMQSNMHDSGILRAPEQREQPKGRTMPTGIPKKKKAKRTSKKAAVVKKAAKKTMKRRKRKA